MQDKQTNKNQLEDYFHVAANRGSMYSRNEIEQLISTDKIVKNDVTKRKTNTTKILTIMTLITITIAALIWIINPAEQKITENENTVIAVNNNDAEATSSKIPFEKEESKLESKKSKTNNSKSEVKQKVAFVKENNQKTEESKPVNEIKSADKKESKELIENQNVNTLISSSESKEKYAEGNKDDKQIKLEGIHFIELSKEELLQIGFRVNGDTVFNPTNGAYTFAYSMDGTIFKIHGEKAKIQKVNFISPILVTDDLGNWRSSQLYKGDEERVKFTFKDAEKQSILFQIDTTDGMTMTGVIEKRKDKKTGKITEVTVPMDEYEKRSDQRILDRINTFIPIRIRTGVEYTKEDSLAKRHRPDLILWFEPIPQFIKMLPKELRNKIQNEYAQISKQPEKSETTTSSNCEYFEVCRSTLKSATDVIIFPNPALETTNMKFILKAETSLRVNLYDISGRLVKELKSFSKFSPGQHQLRLDLNGITEGMYLIVLESDKGETNIQRLVKGKN